MQLFNIINKVAGANMKQATLSIIVRAKANIQRTMQNRRLNHESNWPPHSILCSCRACEKVEFTYIKEMRKENRLKKQKVNN